MNSLPDYFYHVNLISITCRLLLAVLLGGIIGLERGLSKHTAGFRTHILVCLGATLAMLTNQYIYENITQLSDPSRLGAQVITGVGFLGVGTILVTGPRKIKGLTTAAGLWASACTGLAIGIGFYSAAIITALLMLVCLSGLPKLENYVYNRSRIMELYIEITALSDVKEFFSFVRSSGFTIHETHFETSETGAAGAAFQLTIKIPKALTHEQVVDMFSNHSYILLVEEI